MKKGIYYVCRSIYNHRFDRVRMVLFSLLFPIPILAIDNSSEINGIESQKQLETILNRNVDGVLQKKRVTGKVIDEKVK